MDFYTFNLVSSMFLSANWINFIRVVLHTFSSCTIIQIQLPKLFANRTLVQVEFCQHLIWTNDWPIDCWTSLVIFGIRFVEIFRIIFNGRFDHGRSCNSVAWAPCAKQLIWNQFRKSNMDNFCFWSRTKIVSLFLFWIKYLHLKTKSKKRLN